MAKSTYNNVPKAVMDTINAGIGTLEDKLATLDTLEVALGAIKAAAQVNVATADAVASVAAPTKAEFDAVVALANANKAAINGLLGKLRTAGLLAN